MRREDTVHLPFVLSCPIEAVFASYGNSLYLYAITSNAQSSRFGWMYGFEIVMLLCVTLILYDVSDDPGYSYFRVAEASTCIFQPFNFTVDIFVETQRCLRPPTQLRY